MNTEFETTSNLNEIFDDFEETIRDNNDYTMRTCEVLSKNSKHIIDVYTDYIYSVGKGYKEMFQVSFEQLPKPSCFVIDGNILTVYYNIFAKVCKVREWYSNQEGSYVNASPVIEFDIDSKEIDFYFIEEGVVDLKAMERYPIKVYPEN